MKVNQFLKNAKTFYNELSKIRIVIGNQAADLDSIVSSISMAYFLTNTSKSNYVPIINSNKSIVKSKKECMYLFDYLSIDLENDLIFISDWKKSQISEVVLVDHNELDDKEKELNFLNLVTGVIDHHVDKEMFQNSNPRLIDISAGSCATLVGDLFLKSKIELDESFASMMIFPILSDTNNLKIRASPKDIQIVEYLKQFTSLDTTKLYEKIEDFKFNSDSTTEDLNSLLIKDYKHYGDPGKYWGMSSVNFCVQDWLKLNKDLNRIDQFMKEKDLVFYAILSCFKTSSNEFKRDLILLGSSQIINLIKNNFTKISEVEFILDECFDKEKFSYALYDVKSVSLTRKYWQPLLENLLKDQL